MRAFKKIIPPHYFCGLDLGTHSLKASLVRAEDAEHLELLGVFEQKTSGLKDAAVTDLGEFAECVRQTLEGLNKMTAVQVKCVHCGIGGDLVSVRPSQSIIPLVDNGNKIINGLDVRRVRQQARILGIQLEEEIIQDFPQHFKIDEQHTAFNPVGLFGRKLEGRLLLIVSHLLRTRNLTRAIHQAGYDTASLSYSSGAAGQVVFDNPTRVSGALLMDIGSRTSHLLFYQDGLLKDVGIIPWGGENLTRRLAEHLGVTADLAEEIKKSHARAFGAEEQGEEELLVKKENGYIPIKRSAVIEAVEGQVQVFLEAVAQTLKGNGWVQQLNQGIVMIGGGSLVPGLMERLESTTQLPVKAGTLTKGLKNAGIFAASVGLAQMNFRKNDMLSAAVDSPRHWSSTLVNKMREVYQEYF